MKASYVLVVISALLPLMHSLGQAPQPPSRVLAERYGVQRHDAELTRFDLDFPGGTPRELVAAIQRAMDRPLNAIVADEYDDVRVPALKMNHVDVSQLFQALEQASRRSEQMPMGIGNRSFTEKLTSPSSSNFNIFNTAYGFVPGPGPLSDDTIWYFHVERAPTARPQPAPPKTCRFYNLTPFWDRDISIDDITTAIDTGWKMLGESSPPKISFHKDTKLLIAVGEPNKLEIIDAALKALEMPKAAPAAGGQASSPQPSQPAKKFEASKNSGGK